MSEIVDAGASLFDRLIGEDRVAGQLYTDPTVFEVELERIHHRGWAFVGHESEVATPGEFVTRRLGRRPVLMTRDDAGDVRLWSNRCPHRGATVCALDNGHTRYFRCPYHAWTFDTAGALVALPAEEGFGQDFDRATHGLASVPRMESYRGFVFGSWSHDGQTLAEYLGNARDVIDRVCDVSPVGEISLRSGWLRHRIHANWKMAAENVCDFYHPPITHASSGLLSAIPPGYFSDSYGGVTRDLGGGHGEVDYRTAEGRTSIGLGPHAFIFPNLFIESSSIFVIQPVSVSEMVHLQTPITWIGLDEKTQRGQLRRFGVGFGAAGVIEPDDAATWERMQLGLQAGEPEWVVLERGTQYDGVGEGRALDEIAIRGFWRHYRSLLADETAA
ncbi:MAG: Rieske 2Fe-2S domain-containing protein [Actinomycetota bacterium]|nr:Rieske 2Fe-2S domain-containing protein [Actinomycetota bacterium]